MGLSPLSPSPLFFRVSTKKKKKSLSPHDSQFIQANVRQPFQVPLDSAFDRLKMNSSRPSARYQCRWRSWRKQVDWLAQTTLYQVSQAQTAGWVKRNKENPKLVPARLGAVKLHFRCRRNILDLVVNKHASITMGSSRAFDCVWLCHLCDLLTIAVRDKPAAWLVTVM